VPSAAVVPALVAALVPAPPVVSVLAAWLESLDDALVVALADSSTPLDPRSLVPGGASNKGFRSRQAGDVIASSAHAAASELRRRRSL
jgi:hypothetical protein